MLLLIGHGEEPLIFWVRETDRGWGSQLAMIRSTACLKCLDLMGDWCGVRTPTCEIEIPGTGKVVLITMTENSTNINLSKVGKWFSHPKEEVYLLTRAF